MSCGGELRKGGQLPERAVGCEAFEEGGLDAEVGVEDVAPFAAHEVHRARIVAGSEVCLELLSRQYGALEREGSQQCAYAFTYLKAADER